MRSPQGFGSDRCGDATRAKIAAKQSGEQSHQWRGDEVGYSGIHKRARAILPKVCSMEDSSCAGYLEVALRKEADGPFGEDKRGVYSVRIEDYFRLCRSHHNRYDGKEPPASTRLGRHALARG